MCGCIAAAIRCDDQSDVGGRVSRTALHLASTSDAGDAHVLVEIVRLDQTHHRPVARDPCGRRGQRFGASPSATPLCQCPVRSGVPGWSSAGPEATFPKCRSWGFGSVGVTAQLNDGHDVQNPVDAPVPGPREAVAVLVAGGGIDRGGAVPGGEVTAAGEPADVTDVAEQPGRRQTGRCR
jgi:hypothetical protein